jgi:hypothetical protein
LIIRTALLLLAYLALSVLFGFAAGYIAVTVLPCEWFGSRFEGACGYGALWVAVLIGTLVAALAFGLLTFYALGESTRSSELGSVPIRSLFWLWLVALLAMLVASFLLPFARLGSLIGTAVSLLTLSFFISTSLVLIRRLEMNSFLSLLPLVPFFGTIALVFIVVRKYLGVTKRAP